MSPNGFDVVEDIIDDLSLIILVHLENIDGQFDLRFNFVFLEQCQEWKQFESTEA